MKRILLILLAFNALSSADIVTVDAATGVTTIAGSPPPSTPTVPAGEVKIGGGDIQVGRTSQAAGSQVVRGDDPRMSNSRMAAGGDATTLQGRAPGATNGLATLEGGKIPISQLPVEALNQMPIPNYNINGDVTSITTGGIIYANTIDLTVAQTLGIPAKIYCAGNCVISAPVTATVPLEIEAGGNISINAAITAPFVSLRCLGSVTINGAISAHGTSGVNQWTFSRLNLPSRPYNPEIVNYDPNTGLLSSPTPPDPALEFFRAILVEANNDIITTAAGTLTADDIFLFSRGNITIGAGIRAFWRWWGGAYQYWQDGYRIYNGNAGGTAGGWGRYGSAANASIWRGTANPYLHNTYELARGSGGNPRSDQRGTPGGRISLFAAGNISAAANAISVNSNNNSSSGWYVGGAGTVRAVAAGTISGGVWTANGGTGNGSNEHGPGGGVFTVASAYAGTVTLSASAVSQGVAGTTLQVTLPGDVIRSLASRGIFDAFPPVVNRR